MPKISNVYQDKKSGKWYFVANLGYDEFGKRLRHWGRGYSSQRDAKKAYDNYMNEFSDSAIKKNSTMSYKEFYETYFKPDYKRSVNQRTFENRVSSMEMHFSYFFNRKLKDISPTMMKKWQNTLSEKYTSSYIRNIYGLFQKSLDLAVTLGLINKNVAKQVGNVKKVKNKVEFWTKEEFEKVLTTFDRSNYYDFFGYTVIWFLFMTGLRIGEAQALEWEKDIDFNSQTLRINKSMYYKNSKQFYITEPKTKAGNRTISLDDDTIKLLEEWKVMQSNNVPSKYILSHNGLPTNKGAISYIIKHHSALASVNRIRTHALRHSHASLLISMGENALVVRDRLGHEEITTTLGTYGHLYENANKEVAQKLTNIINIPSTNAKRKFISNQYVKHNK